jgi:deoxyadenosine/deoxycytidine kinase
MSKTNHEPTIAIVGPCASGKTTLAQALRVRNLPARQIAQEHSYVSNMWQVLTKPTVLIYLDASFPVCTQRKSLSWSSKEYDAQKIRLQHAQENCQIYIDTDELTPDEVLQKSILALNEIGIETD